jgi:hypothetical protein
MGKGWGGKKLQSFEAAAIDWRVRVHQGEPTVLITYDLLTLT